MAERKSRPRTDEVDVDETARTRRERMQLVGLLFSAIAIVFLMFIIAGFIRGDGAPMPALVGLGITLAVGGLLLFLASRTGKSAA